MGKLDCFAINQVRAHQSNVYLKQAIGIINEMRKEVK